VTAVWELILPMTMYCIEVAVSGLGKLDEFTGYSKGTEFIYLQHINISTSSGTPQYRVTY